MRIIIVAGFMKMNDKGEIHFHLLFCSLCVKRKKALLTGPAKRVEHCTKCTTPANFNWKTLKKFKEFDKTGKNRNAVEN